MTGATVVVGKDVGAAALEREGGAAGGATGTVAPEGPGDGEETGTATD